MMHLTVNNCTNIISVNTLFNNVILLFNNERDIINETTYLGVVSLNKRIISLLSAVMIIMTGCSQSNVKNNDETIEEFETQETKVEDNAETKQEGDSQEIMEEPEEPEINIPMTKEDFDFYFSGNPSNTVSVLDVGKISLNSGHFTALDCFYYGFMGEGIPFYTENIPTGEYEVKVCAIDHEMWGERIAAALVSFTDEKPYEFKMALYESQDVTSLEEGYYFGFGVDSGLAALADSEIMQEFLDYQDKYAKENPSKEFYTDELEPMLEEGYKKYPEATVDFIDYVIPGTDHHLVIMESGFGDGIYPVYFGYSESGELCCAVVQFIYPTEM